MKHWLLIAMAPMVAHSAQSAVMQIDVPAHVRWCRTVTANVEGLTSPETQQAEFEQGEETLLRCARLQEIAEIGVPFVKDSAIDSADPAQARLTFCAAVAANVDACDGIDRQVVPARKVLAAVCTSDKVSDCMAEIEAALKVEPFKIDEAAVANIQWRFVPVSSDTPSAPDIALALTTSQGRAVRQRTSTATFTAHVVVAAPLP